MAQKYKRTQYNDGVVVLSNLRKKKGSIPVFGENDSYTATKVTTWYDGTPMSTDKADGSVYLQLKETNEFFRVNLPNWGETFLEKNTMAEMRGLSPVEILLLKAGYYKGVGLSGYYVAGDTSGRIEYYISSTSATDDGGSVITVGGIKLEHEFKYSVDLRYYGVRVNDDISDVAQTLTDKGFNIDINLNATISKSIVIKTGLQSFNNSTIKASGLGFENNIAITFIAKYKYIKNINFDLGTTSEMDNSVDCMLSLTGDCHNNTIDNISFINFGRHVAVSSTPPLSLVSKDESNDYSYGEIGSVRNNIFSNISFKQFQNTRIAFCVRVLTNWLKERSIDSTVNKTSDNIFSNIRIEGSFLWNAIELAGTGTVRNVVKDSYIDCDAITALDIDKGASYNILDSNTVNCGLAEWASDVETSSYIFSAIQDHGSNENLINYSNKVLNNKVFIKAYTVINGNENGIGVQYTDGSQILNNSVETLKSNINSFTILGETYNLIVSGNNFKSNRSGISFNASRGKVGNVQISNNNILSRVNCIILNPIVDVGNINVRIYDNILKSTESVTGLIVINNINNVLIGYNSIEGNIEKITIGGDSLNVYIVGNTFIGNSPVMLRINQPSTIYNNTNLATSNTIAGAAVSSSNLFLNSWQSTSPTVKGLVNQSAKVDDVSTTPPSPLSAQTVTTIEEAQTAINNLVTMVNAMQANEVELKAKLNAKLTADRTSGQQSTT